MSANKSKYFTVTTTTVVSAPNKTKALLAAQGKRVSDAKILSSEVDGQQIYASEAKAMAASA